MPVGPAVRHVMSTRGEILTGSRSSGGFWKTGDIFLRKLVVVKVDSSCEKGVDGVRLGHSFPTHPITPDSDDV